MGEGQVGALVLAGGRGERLGSPLPKAFVAVAGVPMLVRAVEALGANVGVRHGKRSWMPVAFIILFVYLLL